MPQIVPIKELRNTNEISKLCHKINEPVFITKQGYGDLVVMSVETYDRIMGYVEIDKAIRESEDSLAAGNEPIRAEAAFTELRRKHLG